ncbi:MAG: HU family DNA-binding protein [Kiloniellales bacterium]
MVQEHHLLNCIPRKRLAGCWGHSLGTIRSTRKSGDLPMARKRAAKKTTRRAKKKAGAKRKTTAKRTAVRKKTARKKTARKKTARRKTAAKRAAPVVKLKPTSRGGSDRENLVKVLQATTGITKISANNALNALLITMGLSIAKNKSFQLVGFGTFRVSKRKARWGVNPATGQRIRIKASKSVRFKPGTHLKASL